MQTIKHRERHEFLHSALDELVADFITHTNKLPGKTTVLELIQWSSSQALNPSEQE
jgi:hypothetical protein